MDKFLAKKNPIFKQINATGNNQPNQVNQAEPQLQSEKQDYVYTGFGVINADQIVRYRVNGAILQLALRSMYENARLVSVWRTPSYQQLQADLYFLFHLAFNPSIAANDASGMTQSMNQKSNNVQDGFDFLPSVIDDTFPVYSGLFNEVISSSMARFKSAPIEQDVGAS